MRAMIVSVGVSEEPVVKAIEEHRPEYVCFFSSQKTVEKIGTIKTKLKEKQVTISDYKFICDHEDDLLHCYSIAVECARKIRTLGFQPEEVVVDYTGGTKTMTAALALATVGQGFSFSYVGGKERTKDGVGTVVTGTEIVKTGASPWQIHAVEEKKRIALFVKSFQYEAAIITLRETMPRLGEAEREVWRGISEIMEGYLAWDSFDHGKAVRCLADGVRSLDLCAKFGLAPALDSFLKNVKTHFGVLEDMKDKTNFFKTLHPVMVSDLIANARRRYLQNKYDDAVARLYRALEMSGQIAFEQAIGCSTSNAHAEKLPEELREEYVRRYRSPEDERIRLPLFATFKVLKQVNHPLGEKFSELDATLRKLISSRNGSILAHGVQPVTRETYEMFAGTLQSLFVTGDLIEFPILEW